MSQITPQRSEIICQVTELPDVHYIENTIPSDDGEKSFIETVQSKLSGCGNHLKEMKLELVVFLFTFSYSMTGITSTTMIMEKVCLVNFEYSSCICSNLENYTDIKSSVVKVATNYQLGHSLIKTAPAALLSFFIGPWSDHYGRKFPILLAIFGMSLDALGSAVCAYILESRVEYYFIPALLTGISGGPVTVLAVMYSYVSDSTSLEKRTVKYALLAMAAGFSLSFGATAGGWIYHSLDYLAVFFFSAGGLLLSFVCVVLLLKETRGLDNGDPWPFRLRQLFSCKSFKESFAATAKIRPNQGRKQIALLISSMCFLTISVSSTGDINFLYAHNQFGWDNPTYSTITSIHTLVSIVALVVLIPLLIRYEVGDPILGLMGTVSLLASKIGIGLAYTKVIFHIGSLVGIFGGIATFAVRSRISKVVSNEDLGKVFSFVSIAESLPPILASVLMSQMFTIFLNKFPGAPYILLAIFLIFPLAVFSWMTRLPKI